VLCVDLLIGPTEVSKKSAALEKGVGLYEDVPGKPAGTAPELDRIAGSKLVLSKEVPVVMLWL
jgi:hypothetical protein